MRMISKSCWVVALGVWGAILPTTAPAQTAETDIYQAIVKREFGTAMNELAAVEKDIANAKLDQYPEIEARLIAVLEAPEATLAGKQFACQMLRTVGSPKCIPAVSKLLTDEKLSHMARFVFLGMRAPAAAAALREALGQTQGNLRIGILNTIGDRRDRSSLKVVTAMLEGNDEATTSAALNALGKIGGPRAAAALEAAKVPESLQTAWGDAYMRCAESVATANPARAEKMYRTLFDGVYPLPVRAAAFGAMVQAQSEQAVPLIVKTLSSREAPLQTAALGAVVSVPGHAATRAFAQELGGLGPEAKVTLLRGLAARGDAEGLTERVNQFAVDANPVIRETAITALARLGDASSVPVLAAALKQPELAAEVRQTLLDLQGAGVVAALIQQAESGEAVVRQGMLSLLAERRQTEALPVIRKAVKDDEAGIRQAALKALAVVGTQEDLAALAELVLSKPEAAERDQVAEAMSEIGRRMPDKAASSQPVIQALSKADAPTKICLLTVLSAMGSDPALQAVRGLLAGEGELRKAAIRALVAWSSSAPMADLLRVAKEDQDKANQILALGGYLRMLGQPETGAGRRQQGQSAAASEQRVQAYREAMALATRTEDRRLVLAGLAGVAHEEALKMVQPYLDDPALTREAFISYEKIAESLARRQPAVAKEALQRVLEKAADSGLRDQAKRALDRIR